jgi:hypothetical protein
VHPLAEIADEPFIFGTKGELAVRSAKPDGERRWSASAAGLFQIKHQKHNTNENTNGNTSA